MAWQGFCYNETKEQLFILVIFGNENMRIHKWKKKAEAPEVMDKPWYYAVVPVLKNCSEAHFKKVFLTSHPTPVLIRQLTPI